MINKYNKVNVINPKRNKLEDTNFYSYYAGFSDKFATELLKSTDLPNKPIVLDPWNGSGTTVKSSVLCGFDAVGIDLNPAMVIIAKGNSLLNSEYGSIKPLLKEINKKALLLQRKISITENDLLNNWFTEKSIKSIRSIERSISVLLIEEQHGENVNWVNTLSYIASFFYIALFRTLHQFSSGFKTSNPTWIKKAKNNENKISIEFGVLLSIFNTEVQTLIEIGNKDIIKYNGRSTITVGSSTNLNIIDRSIDLVLTSPPYCTRIDYAIATSLELAVLNFTAQDQDKLRRQLIGTSTVPKVAPLPKEIWGDACNELINNISKHNSKASNTYYLKNHLQYFDSLATSVGEISRVLKTGAFNYMVVQDSYYKDVYNDLPKICTEIAANYNLKLREKFDFNSNQSMVGLNKKSKIYRGHSETVESVLCFEKQ